MQSRATRRIAAAAAVLLYVTRLAPAAEQRDPIAAPIFIQNDSGGAMQCQVLAAHWYARAAQTVPAGAVLRIDLAFDVRSAEVTDRALEGLPVERLYCGPAGRAWQARAEVDFRALAARAAAGQPATVACRAVPAGLACADAPPVP